MPWRWALLRHELSAGSCELQYCAWHMLSRVWLFATLWTVARQSPPPMDFSRQDYWSEWPCPLPGRLLDPGIEPVSLGLAGLFFSTEPPGSTIVRSTYSIASLIRNAQKTRLWIDQLVQMVGAEAHRNLALHPRHNGTDSLKQCWKQQDRASLRSLCRGIRGEEALQRRHDRGRALRGRQRPR